MIEQLVLIVHVLIAFAIIALILLQQGKGADMGASFGSGGSQTLFGPAGGGNALTRATAVLATLFFITSFGLAIIAKQKTEIGPGGSALSEVAEQLEAQAAEESAAEAQLLDIPESLSPDELLPGEFLGDDLPGDDLPVGSEIDDLPN